MRLNSAYTYIARVHLFVITIRYSIILNAEQVTILSSKIPTVREHLRYSGHKQYLLMWARIYESLRKAGYNVEDIAVDVGSVMTTLNISDMGKQTEA